MDQRSIGRRSFLAAGAAALAAPIFSTLPRPARAAGSVFAYVGSYTPNGPGIALYRMDPATGALTPLKAYRDVKNPSWLALDPSGTHLYAVNETDSGAVSAFAIDRDSGELTPRNTVSSQGRNPAHLSVHPSGKFVLVGNYSSGSVTVLPIIADGALGDATDVQTNSGARHPDHAADDPPGNFGVSDHAAAHVHMVAADPSGNYIFVNDAGLDRIYVWTLDLSSGKLRPARVPFIESTPGAAPRHFAFHPNGRVFYDLFEHDAVLAVYDYDAHSGTIALKESISALPAGFTGSNLASELLVSADGRFVYAANRLHDTIAIFSVAADGRLAPAGEEWTRSDYPRSMAIDPSGAFLFACNQKGDAITTFRIDPQTGGLSFTGAYTPIGSPVTMTFLR